MLFRLTSSQVLAISYTSILLYQTRSHGKHLMGIRVAISYNRSEFEKGRHSICALVTSVSCGSFGFATDVSAMFFESALLLIRLQSQAPAASAITPSTTPIPMPAFAPVESELFSIEIIAGSVGDALCELVLGAAVTGCRVAEDVSNGDVDMTLNPLTGIANTIVGPAETAPDVCTTVV